MRISTTSLFGVALIGIALAAPVRADLFRCPKPDGSVVFTDSEASCPGAIRHEPSGVVQTVPGRAPASPSPSATRVPAARTGARPDARMQAAREATWRQKKQRAVRRVAELEVLHERLRRYVTLCNRDHKLWEEDEAGLRSRVSCDEVKSEFAKVELRRDEARAYLDGGLQRECRRTGCLPGWIR